MTRDDIIEKIEACAAARGISPATVTSRAVGNSRLYSRMKNGGGCNVMVAERLATWIAKTQPEGAAA